MSQNLYNHTACDRALACMIVDTDLANSDKYPLNSEDFTVQLHIILYKTLHNLNLRGVKRATFFDIVEYVKPWEAYYNALVEEGNIDKEKDNYIYLLEGLAEVKNFEYYYDSIKKMSCLRDLYDDGENISEFWDIDDSDEENFARIEEISIKDIVDIYEAKAIKIKRKYSRTQVKEEYRAGTDFKETKELFKEEPLVGNSFQSEFLNDIYRGMFGFLLRGAKSGGGKSILSIGDLCKTTITRYWDYDLKDFVINKSREGSSLFINTELELRTELDPIVIAWISGVERSHIIDGKYLEGEEARVDIAGDILEESGLYIVDDPEFTTKSLKETIKDYTLNKNIKTVCFDYVQNNGFVAKEISMETKVPQREDMVLLALTDRLKQVQRDCDISLISSVQTNGMEDNMAYPTESCLAGGKAQVRKTNGTMIMLPPTKKELENTSGLFAKYQGRGLINKDNLPNNIVHIIKGRNSKYGKHIKVFQYMDLGTGRTTDLYCTNKNNEPIKVERKTIEHIEETK